MQGNVNMLMCLNGGEVVKQAVFQRKSEYTPESTAQREGTEKIHKKQVTIPSNQFINGRLKTDMWKQTRITKKMSFILQEA